MYNFQVYLTKFIPTGKRYATKVIQKKLLAKENKIKTVGIEKKVLNLMNHPNIISLFCTFQDKENLYFVLELAPGGEMFQILSKHGPLSLEAAQFYIAELVLALEYMHSLGIIHRDLKPENILLSRWMHTLVTDFGTAKYDDPNETQEQLNNVSKSSTSGYAQKRKGTFCGTAEYVSPEILLDGNVTMACDLWALGCILYQYLTGKHPFKAESEYLIFQKIKKRELEYPKNFPLVARNLCDRLIQLNPEDRLGYGEKGYEKLKSHPFFNSIEWDKLSTTTPPEIIKQDHLRENSIDHSDLDSSGFTNDEDSDYQPSTPRSQISKTSSTLSEKTASLTSSSKIPKEDLTRWTPFLIKGENIIFTGEIIKRRRLSAKTRQFILTDGPRLIYIDPKKNIIKGSIPFTTELKVEKKSPKYFNIRTTGRLYVLECKKKDSDQWINHITDLIRTISSRR